MCLPKCTCCKSDPYEKFKLIACGFGHCMAVTEHNQIVIWGNNKLGQIGNDEKVVKGSPIVHAHKIMVVDESIELSWSFTDSLKATMLFFTQYLPSLLPIKSLQQVKLPKKVEIKEIDPEIVAIACGSFHSLVLFKSGNLYGWGDNKYGQLGVYSKKTILAPMLICSQVKEIASTNLYTLALTYEGVLYAMGDNTYSQLGNNKQGFYEKPVEVIGLKFYKIATINQLSMGITMDNKCYIWGLYKMVKQRKVLNDPNRLLEQNNEQQGIIHGRGMGSNLAQNVGLIAADVAINQGINELINSSHNNHDDHGDHSPKETNEESVQEQTEQNKNRENEQDENGELEDNEQSNEDNNSEGKDSQAKENQQDQSENDEEVEEGGGEEEEEERVENRNQSNANNSHIFNVTRVFDQESAHQNERDNTMENNLQDDFADSQDDADVEKLTYVIIRPTEVQCKSFEKIIAKVLSLTNFSIKLDVGKFDPDEDDQGEIIPEVMLTEIRSGMSSEMSRNVKILGQELRKVGGHKVKVFFGDHNKFSVISDSYVLPNGDLNIKDIQQSGKSMFGSKTSKAENPV